MKKKLMLLLLVFLLVGCTKVNKYDKDYEKLVYDVLDNSTTRTNKSSTGFKYYLPIGVSIDEDLDYNLKLKTDNNNMYLFVDVVSYYYKKALNYNYPYGDDAIFSKISYQGKEGFILVVREKTQNYLEIIYNYAKIELYTSDTEINNMIAKSLIILSSIDYNDVIIEKYINQGYFASYDKVYTLKQPKNAESNFLDVLDMKKEENNEEETSNKNIDEGY